ncbi:MAG: HEAT repeat domain-containing protein [Phycisphaerales bacterium]|nr:HEAT repeat domain-containing protein [Phycisphaerales bacterium]
MRCGGCVNVVLAIAAGCSLWPWGCAGVPQEASFDRPDPSSRLLAIQEAAQKHDRDSLRSLIRALDSDDPAERLLSIRALEHRTGQTLGYDHSARRAGRSEAVQRWVEWFDRGGTDRESRVSNR